MRTADVEIKGCICIFVEELCDLRGHVCGTSRVNSRFKIERIDALGFYVFLSDTRRGESVCFQNLWYGLHVFVRAKPVNSVAVSVLSVCVAMLSGEDTRTTHGAGGTCTECMVEHDTAFREGINVWCSDNVISVTFRDTAPIVSDDEHHVFVRIAHGFPYFRHNYSKS